MHGGGDRDWLRGLDPGEVAEDGTPVLGAHRGHLSALNVKNPQSGFVYYHEAKRPGSIQKRLNEGWIFVGPDEPEQWGGDLPPELAQELGGPRAVGDVLLMKIPVEKYRQLKAETAELKRANVEGVTTSYLDKGAQRQHQLGLRGPSEDLYYRDPRHGTSSE